MKNSIKGYILVLAIVVILVGIFLIIVNNKTIMEDIIVRDSMIDGISSDISGSGAYYDLNKYETAPYEQSDSLLGEKVVYTANISFKTDDYDKSVNKVKDLFDSYDALISNVSENSYTNMDGKDFTNAHMVVKVPQANFKGFTDALKGSGLYISSYNENIEDITEAYMDVEANLSSLKLQEEVLNDLLKKAKTVDEIIQITKEKQAVIKDIEYNTKLQQTYDKRVEYSTVTITITEVVSTDVVEKGFLERIIDTIISSLEGLKLLAMNLLLITIYLLPFIIVFGLLVFVVVVIIKKANKKNKNKNKISIDNNDK